MRYLCLLLLFVISNLRAEPAGGIAAPLSQPSSINPVEEKVFILDALMWSRPRTGAEVSAMLPLREAVQNMLNTPGSRLAVRYPGGDAGSLWAQELLDWLVSMGVEPETILMQPGSAFEDRIELRVIVR